MSYKELLNKSADELIKQQTDSGVDYTKAIVILKKQLFTARIEALNEEHYHETSAQVWGEGSGDAGLIAEYGSYDKIKAEIKKAKEDQETIMSLRDQVCQAYIDNRLQMVHEFPKRGYREEDSEYAQRLQVYKQNVEEVAKSTKKYEDLCAEYEKLQKVGYDDESRSSYYEWSDKVDNCLNAIKALPYADIDAVKGLSDECKKGLEKAEEKLAEINVNFGK